MKRTVIVLVGLLLSFLTLSSMAGWFAQGNLGMVVVGHPKGDIIVSSTATDIIEPNRDRVAPELGLAAGYAWLLGFHYVRMVSVLLSLAYIHKLESRGRILDMGVLKNYNYQTFVNSFRTLINIKLNIIQWHHLSPFVLLGGGVVWNQATLNKKAIPGAGATPANVGFKSRTTAHFAYQIAVGTDYQINPTMILSGGYRYADLGDIQLNNITNGGVRVIRGPRFPLHIHELFVSIQKTFNV